jgi:hypothetical protein
MDEKRLCRLQYAAHRIEECPEDRCPFWEAGGAVVDGRCAVEHIDISGNPALVHWLLKIRSELDQARSGEETRSLFYRLHRRSIGKFPDPS